MNVMKSSSSLHDLAVVLRLNGCAEKSFCLQIFNCWIHISIHEQQFEPLTNNSYDPVLFYGIKYTAYSRVTVLTNSSE